jgi:hypothetical protein
MATRGRPKLADRRSHVYGVRFNEEERIYLDALTQITGLTLAQFLRALVKSATVDEIKARVDR